MDVLGAGEESLHLFSPTLFHAASFWDQEEDLESILIRLSELALPRSEVLLVGGGERERSILSRGGVRVRHFNEILGDQRRAGSLEDFIKGSDSPSVLDYEEPLVVLFFSLTTIDPEARNIKIFGDIDTVRTLFGGRRYTMCCLFRRSEVGEADVRQILQKFPGLISPRRVCHFNPFYEGEEGDQMDQKLETVEKASQLLASYEAGIYRNYFQSNPEPMLILDRSTGSVVAANDALSLFLGYTTGKLKALNGKDLFSNPFRKQMEILEASIGSLEGIFVPLIRASGEIGPVEVLVSEVEINYRSCLYLILHKAADRRHYQQLIDSANRRMEQAFSAKKMFLANLSHELRTPLNGIMGMCDLLSETDLDDHQRDLLELLSVSSRDLFRVIGDLLDYSKIDITQLNIEKNTFSLPLLLEEVADPYERLARSKGVGFVKEFRIGKESVYTSDRGRLVQILNQLLSNAVKFTDNGGIFFRCFIDNDLVFQIQDSGVGIGEEDLEAVFDSFFQAEEIYTKRHQGLGLGLAITRELVAILAGSIDVESREGDGALFTVRLPWRGERLREDLASVSEGKSEKIRILVAEDDGVNQLYLRRLLEPRGYRVSVAEDGEKALRSALESRFDLILMDIGMPVLDGAQAASQIRSKLGEDTPPIVAITGYINSSGHHRFRDSGFDDVISKPFVPKTLYDVIGRIFPEEKKNSRP